MEMEIIQCYQTKNPCYRKGTPMKPVGIVVHSTGANNPHLCRYVDCPERLGVNRYGNHWNRPEAATLVHGAIGLDKEGFVTVVNTLPYTMAAWGVGKGSRGSYNYDPTGHIQFEMCEDDLTDPSYFDQVMGTAVAYCARLCREYGLAAESVVSHKEAHAQGYASNHGDPENWMGRFGMTMEDFRARVRAKLKGEVTIMGKVVNRDELVAWIDAHAVEVEEQPEPEVKPEPVAIKARATRESPPGRRTARPPSRCWRSSKTARRPGSATLPALTPAPLISRTWRRWADMDTAVIVAIISLVGTLGGSFGGVLVSSKLTNYRLQQLENKVQEHNNYARRLPVVEEQIKVINHRVADLEAHEERRNA